MTHSTANYLMLRLPNTIKTVPFCIPQPEGSITQDKHTITEHPDIGIIIGLEYVQYPLQTRNYLRTLDMTISSALITCI